MDIGISRDKRKLDDEECARICKAHNVRLKINDYDVFYKTLVNNRINDPELVKVIFRDCKNAGEWSCHTVHDGRFYKCSIAPFMGARLALKGVAFDNIPIDGVALHDNANLYEEVDRCLNDQTPLAACSYCLGTSGPPVAHRQLNRIGRSRRLKEDDSSDIEAVRLISLRAKESENPSPIPCKTFATTPEPLSVLSVACLARLIFLRFGGDEAIQQN